MKKGAVKSGRAASMTRQQALFVENYLITMNGADAVRAAGYKTKDPRNTASVLLSKPQIKEALDKGMAERVSRLRINQDYVLLKLVEIVESNIGDYLEFKGRSVKLRDMAELSRDKLGLIKEVAETEAGVKISLPDKIAALDKLARHLGMFERHRQSRKRPDNITRDVLGQLLEKKISPVEAALKLEAEGLPLPESLRLLLAKAEPEPPADDNGAYAVIPPEEMAERARQRREAAARQQQDFVKTRAEEVAELKAEMGGGSFQPQAADDGEKRP